MAETPIPEGALVKRDMVDVVAARIRQFLEDGHLHLPPAYSSENALKSAWLQIQGVVDKDKRPALSVCTRESVANALLDMVVQGLNPAKRQCYWLVYGQTLVCQRSYFGAIALAKRCAGVRDVWADVVYQGDVFEYAKERGSWKIVRHDQKIENINPDKILLAYAGVEFADPERPALVGLMTMAQIRKSWAKSRGNPTAPDSVHSQFPDQMAMRTVMVRTLKTLINSSSDDWLLAESLDRQDTTELAADAAAEEAALEGRVLDLPPQDADTGEVAPAPEAAPVATAVAAPKPSPKSSHRQAPDQGSLLPPTPRETAPF